MRGKEYFFDLGVSENRKNSGYSNTFISSLNVNNTPVNKDPIDSLQVLYNNFLTSVKNVSAEIPSGIFLAQNYPNPFNPVTNLELEYRDRDLFFENL